MGGGGAQVTLGHKQTHGPQESHRLGALGLTRSRAVWDPPDAHRLCTGCCLCFSLFLALFEANVYWALTGMQVCPGLGPQGLPNEVQT